MQSINDFRNVLSPIQCIFFCEFHHKTGRQLTYQVPENFITKEIFDSLSAYLIPKKELEGSLISVNARDLNVIGYPVGMDDPKFPRNKMIFNLCLVCIPTMKTQEYEPLVEKLAHYLINLEKECDFLFNSETKSKLPLFMEEIKNQLNANKSCVLPITESTTIYLKVPTVHPEPGQVDDLDVPILSISPTTCKSNNLDLTTQKLLPYIDGFRHIQRIASEAEVEISLVKAYIQNLIYYGLVRLISIFQYSNVYVPTARLVELVENAQLQEECLLYVSRVDGVKVNFRNVFQFLCSMNSGVTIKNLCIRYNHLLNEIDERKLVRFGILNGFIRRLQKYPILTLPEESNVTSHRGLYKHFNGEYTYDKICCITNKSYSEVEEKVEKHPSVVVCWK